MFYLFHNKKENAIAFSFYFLIFYSSSAASSFTSVSYTHLDVYKRQPLTRVEKIKFPGYTPEYIAWTEDVSYEPVYRLGEDIFESMENLQEVENLLEMLPGLDCGSCGAPTCKALAEDIVKDHKKELMEDCIYLFRSKFQQQGKKQRCV